MGEADSRNYQKTLSADYTMGDLIQNSNERNARAERLRKEQAIEQQKAQAQKQIMDFIEEQQEGLSLINLFGRDFHEDGVSFNGVNLAYEHKQYDIDAMAHRDFFKEHLTDEQQTNLKNTYDRIMSADKRNWKARLLQHQLQTNTEGLNSLSGQKMADLQAQITKAEEGEKRNCKGMNWFGCAFDDMKSGVGDAAAWLGDKLSAITDVVMEVPVLGDVLQFGSDNFERAKGALDDVGQWIKESGPVGEGIYNAGDWLHENSYKQSLFGEELIEGLTGKQVEDLSLADSAEVMVSLGSGVGGAALLANDLIQDRKNRLEGESSAIEQEIEKQYGQPAPQQPTRGPGAPLQQQPTRGPGAPLQQSSGGNCKPKRKPISCNPSKKISTKKYIDEEAATNKKLL